ncbi:hypothetical protein MTO96_029560 [Rhipicephalus appendiculatus]
MGRQLLGMARVTLLVDEEGPGRLPGIRGARVVKGDVEKRREEPGLRVDSLPSDGRLSDPNPERYSPIFPRRSKTSSGVNATVPRGGGPGPFEREAQYPWT